MTALNRQYTGWTLIVVLSVLSVTPQVSRAEQGVNRSAESPSKAQLQAAKKFFMRGQDLYQEGKYEAAWIEFSSAYEIAPLPDLVFNMARCEVRMNRIKDAIGHYREFLRMRPDDPESDRIRDEIVRLEQQLGRANEQPAAAPPPSLPPPPPSAPRRFPIASAILGGGAVLFVILGGASTGVATSRFHDLETTCKPACTDDQVQTVRTPLNAGYALFGLAAAAAAVGAVMLPFELGLFNKEKGKERSLALRFGPGLLEVAGRY